MKKTNSVLPHRQLEGKPLFQRLESTTE